MIWSWVRGVLVTLYELFTDVTNVSGVSFMNKMALWGECCSDEPLQWVPTTFWKSSSSKKKLYNNFWQKLIQMLSINFSLVLYVLFVCFFRVVSVIKRVRHNDTLASGRLTFDCLANLLHSFCLTPAQPQKTLCKHRAPDAGSVSYNCKKMTCRKDKRDRVDT